MTNDITARFSTVLTAVTRHRIIPVVVLQRAADAAPLAEALLNAGLPIAEITFRTDAAPAALAAMARNPDIIVGAGTITRPEQVDAAADAGARFLVSPGFSAAVLRRAQQRGLPLIVGIATASELMAATDYGVDVVKFFPAHTSGGAAAVKALTGPFPDARFIPTGGITLDNAAEYLQIPAVLAVGGSWLVAPSLIAAQQFGTISQLTTEALTRLAPPDHAPTDNAPTGPLTTGTATTG